MKIPLEIKIKFKLYVIVAFLGRLSQVCGGEGANQHSVLTYGQVTNGVRGEIEVVSHDKPGHLTEIVVWVNQTTPANYDIPANVSDAKFYDNGWDYYQPTNCFCGFIELWDKNSNAVPVLKPEVNLLSAYPSTYNLQKVKDGYFGQFMAYSGPYIFPLALMTRSPRSEILRFQIGEPLKAKTNHRESMIYEPWYSLHDYFAIKEPGEYTFTVWPKIYHRISTNSLDCERLDLPPVTAKFKWDGNGAK